MKNANCKILIFPFCNLRFALRKDVICLGLLLSQEEIDTVDQLSAGEGFRDIIIGSQLVAS